jgi:hypothetical protein
LEEKKKRTRKETAEKEQEIMLLFIVRNGNRKATGESCRKFGEKDSL